MNEDQKYMLPALILYLICSLGITIYGLTCHMVSFYGFPASFEVALLFTLFGISLTIFGIYCYLRM